ncbi:Sec-independent protein translocase subunit TatA/TatB [Thermocrinis sp.]
MDFPEILIILLVAMVVLGPEKTVELATKLGDFLRKIRETWDELRYQMYMENLNRKIMEESENIQSSEEAQEKSILEYIEEVKAEEVKEDESGTTQNAPDGASEGTQTKTD